MLWSTVEVSFPTKIEVADRVWMSDSKSATPTLTWASSECANNTPVRHMDKESPVSLLVEA